MRMRICPLASGSGANCTYVATETTAILVDAGLSARETERRLAAAGGRLEDVRAILLTHEHSDHVAGLEVLHRRYAPALYANSGTIEGFGGGAGGSGLKWRVFANGAPFRVGDIEIEPFSVPHDAYDPVGFVLRAGPIKAGIVTDMGTATVLIRERLRDCRALVLEANHDEQMLRDAERPWPLKQRILSRQGHLSNAHAAALIAEIAGPRLEVLYLAHLSADCNRPELAVAAARATLAAAGFARVDVRVASRDEVSAAWEGE